MRSSRRAKHRRRPRSYEKREYCAKATSRRGSDEGGKGFASVHHEGIRGGGREEKKKTIAGERNPLGKGEKGRSISWSSKRGISCGSGNGVRQGRGQVRKKKEGDIFSWLLARREGPSMKGGKEKGNGQSRLGRGEGESYAGTHLLVFVRGGEEEQSHKKGEKDIRSKERRRRGFRREGEKVLCEEPRPKKTGKVLKKGQALSDKGKGKTSR